AIAEEIVQDVFLKLWEDKALLPTIISLKPYLYRSVINASINAVNRQRNIEKHHEKIAEHDSHHDIDVLDEQNALIVQLYREIELLPEKCRKVFKLSRLEGLKYRDIALQLGISEKTVENHMSNALRILRLRMLQQNASQSGHSKVKYFSLLSLFLY
ncbi:sigma-70 family RNA polymerase sigma factor, partial [Pedobacter sp.]|uniref:sigma-70 family RNA polymerase sigma factor n=1 Tax=Pedobacter sp. TaxID=1411316 RepID=UPI003D7FDEA6